MTVLNGKFRILEQGGFLFLKTMVEFRRLCILLCSIDMYLLIVTILLSYSLRGEHSIMENKRISVLVCFYLAIASILEPLSHIPLPVS